MKAASIKYQDTSAFIATKVQRMVWERSVTQTMAVAAESLNYQSPVQWAG